MLKKLPATTIIRMSQSTSQATPKISAILFDFGKVLTLPPDPGVWQQLQQISGLSDESLHEGYWKYRDDYDSGHLTGFAYWKLVLGYEPSGALYNQLKDADVALWTQMNQPMLRWVAALHRSGFHTGILSNMPDAMAEGITAQFDWIANFDHTIWSYALKLRKPQPEIYAAAAKGLKTPPAEILFIDDKEENIHAAEAYGMQAVLYTNHDGFIHEMNCRGYQSLLEPDGRTPV